MRPVPAHHLTTLRSRLRRRGDRGSAELGVAIVAAAVVAGSLLGTGVARTAVDVTDGVTWLTDSPSGQVVEINPATLEPQASAVVGLPGQQLVLAQDRGRLLVTNRTTGAITSIDLATLLASGRRDAAPGDATTVLLDRGRAFLVDRQNGLVANLDPVTIATRGRVWLAPKGLRDAVIDGTGAVWVAAGDDTLTRLSWSEDSLAFTAQENRTLTKVGGAVRLVAHERGVTVVSPDTGAIIQVGTGRDLVSAAPQMRGRIAPASESASALVPVSVPERDVVVIVRDGARVSEVRTGPMGCTSPGTPVELASVVYVPCPENGRVIRLKPDGGKAGPDILAGGKGAPELVVDDGALLVNVPGSTRGVKVTPDGRTTSFVRFDERLTPTDVDRREREKAEREARKKAEERARKDREQQRELPPTDPPRYNPGGGTLPTTTSGDRQPPRPTVTRTRTGGPRLPAEPTRPPRSIPPTGTPGGSGLQAPVITDVRLSGTGGAEVSWSQPGRTATGYEVLVDGSVAARVSGSTTSAGVTGLAAGDTVTIAVRARFPGGRQLTSGPDTLTLPSQTPPTRPPAPSPAPPSAAPPGAPGGFSATETARARGSVVFALSWSAAPDNGSAITGYTVTASNSSGSDRWSGGGGSASVTLPCPTSGDCGTASFSVTATNAAGTGPAAGTSAAASAPPAIPMPDSGASVVSSQSTSPYDDASPYDRVTTLDLAMPASWATFSGTCAVVTTGPTGGPGGVSCGAGSVSVQVSRVSDTTRTTTHTVTLQATDPDTGRTVDSARYSWTVTWPRFVEPPCGGTTGRICP
ncbi:MAG: hypothetical protein ACRCY8_14610 [Dermatophilaceae bacterium]